MNRVMTSRGAYFFQMDKKSLITDMVQIPEGPFMMGSDKGGEGPAHEVYVDAFYMDVTPVTNAQFKEFIKACPEWQKEPEAKRTLNSYYLFFWRKGIFFPAGKRDHPVVYMNWPSAAAYCNWRSREEGLQECYDDSMACDFGQNGYRLPTEAEFEKAMKGGKETLYPWGDKIDKSVANYDNLIGDTAEVASYPANAYGLYDMSGNIGHWCQDWFDPDYYKHSPRENPTGPGTGTHRSYRGGSWGNTPENHTCTIRFGMPPLNVNPDFGFRCVRKA